MKQTINVNIGQRAFVIDQDAYGLLKNYLDDIRNRCDASTVDEVMNDIEMRISDLFNEALATPSNVVTADMVRHAQAVIGSPDTFGESHRVYDAEPVRSRLTRSRSERVIGGVCGGLADYFKIDVTLLRIITFILIFFGGISIWVYIILWIVIPEEDIQSANKNTNTNSKK